VAITVDECIRRVTKEILRTRAFPESVGKRERLAELEAMLREYEVAKASGITEL
jgi:hypothetical protein